MKVTIKNNKTPAKERKYPCILQWRDTETIVLFKECGMKGVCLQDSYDIKSTLFRESLWARSDNCEWREFQGTITLKND